MKNLTKMKKYLLAGIGAAALAGSGYAIAGPGFGGDRLTEIDANGDGDISRAEATMMSDKMFARGDANNDGVIDSEDKDARQRARFDEIDANNDGKVTQAEIEAHHKAQLAERQASFAENQDERFAAIDSNGDKSLSFEEFEKGREAMRGKGGRDHDGEGRGHGGGHHGKFGGRHGGKGMMMAMADANDDGKITAAEARTAALAHFDEMDADNDGKVTEEERDAAKEAMREKWKQAREARTAAE